MKRGLVIISILVFLILNFIMFVSSSNITDNSTLSNFSLVESNTNSEVTNYTLPYSNSENTELNSTLVEPNETAIPIEMPENKSVNGESPFICVGCELNKKCYPFGFRKDGKYCSESEEFVTQKSNNYCENSFECSSNLCVSGKCIDESFIQKIINWFKKLFGGEEEKCTEKENSCCLGDKCITTEPACKSNQNPVFNGCDKDCKPKWACETGEKQKVLLIVKDSLLPSLQSDLDIWKQDIKNEYNYQTVQKSVSAETPEEIKDFIKTQDNSGDLVGVLLVGDIPTTFSDLCFNEYGYCPSDHYYYDLGNSCFSILKTGNRCDGYTCNEINYYTPADETECSNFINTAPKFWIARLTTPNAQGNNVTLLSEYFKRNHNYRTGKKLYEHKILLYEPIVNSDFPSDAEQIRQVTLNQGSEIEKLNYYSGDVNFISDPAEGDTISDVYSEELKKPYEYVYYNGHGTPLWTQGMMSDKLMIIKPKPLFYELDSCSVGDFTTDNYLAGIYLFAGDGLIVRAATVPIWGSSGFPSYNAFILDNGFNFGDIFITNPAMHLLGDPTLRLTKKTNSDVEIKNIDLGQMQIPGNINDFYYKYFNITIKNLGNEKINLLLNGEEGTNFKEIGPSLYLNKTLRFPFSIGPGEERILPSELFVHGSSQPVKFSINYTFYSNAKNPFPKFSISGELVK